MSNMPQIRTKRRRVLGVVTACLAWAGCLGFGWHAAMVYDTTPGKQAARAPLGQAAQKSAFRCVVVAHALCPCTRATLRGIKAAIETYPNDFECEIVFAGMSPDGSENLDIAESIPGAKVTRMSASDAAKKFDAHTSGQTYIFDRNGKEIYSGGVTSQRGLDDPRYALEIFKEIYEGGLKVKPLSVYGCALGD